MLCEYLPDYETKMAAVVGTIQAKMKPSVSRDSVRRARESPTEPRVSLTRFSWPTLNTLLTLFLLTSMFFFLFSRVSNDEIYGGKKKNHDFCKPICRMLHFRFCCITTSVKLLQCNYFVFYFQSDEVLWNTVSAFSRVMPAGFFSFFLHYRENKTFWT